MVLMPPKRQRVATKKVWSRRQLRAGANHGGAGAFKVARDFKLGGQLAPPAVSGGSGAELRHDGRRGQVNYDIVGVVQHPRLIGRKAITPGNLLGRVHRSSL
jgi:hypothetical protein